MRTVATRQQDRAANEPGCPFCLERPEPHGVTTTAPLHVRCSGCGHRYTANLPEEAERNLAFSALEEEEFTPWSEIAEVRRLLTDRRDGLERFERDVAPHHRRGRVLDLFASTGGLLAAARAAGYEVHGYERSAIRRRLALAHRSLELTPGELFTAAVPTSQPDVVVAYDAFQRERDPFAVLGAVRRIIDPSGVVILGTDDDEALPRPDEARGDDPVLQAHRYRSFDLERLLERSGFLVIDCYSPDDRSLVAVGSPT